MHELAVELNEILQGTVAGTMLSSFGKRMYFPKGIVAQSAEAKTQATRYNATAGVAMSNGQPMYLSDIYDQFVPGSFTPEEIFNYALGGGDKRLRKLWYDEMLLKNPSLRNTPVSLPIVTAGLTHGVSIAAQMFTEEGDTVVIPDLFWDNYDLIFKELCQATIKTFPLYDDQMHFNVPAMKEAIVSCGDQARLLLNFPNNPTGYTPSNSEMKQIADTLVELARSGMKLVVISDDAYFGLFYEDDVCHESLFAYLAGAHENILAVKGDAATKEDMVWGFRVGFLTYGCKGFSEAQYDALLKKTMGAIRCTVSNCDRPGQSMLVRAMEQGTSYQADKDAAKREMERRYRKFIQALERHPDTSLLKPYPFNSGYFMAFRCAGDAEALRRYLLDTYQIGTINILGTTLRVAYCSVECDNINQLVDLLYQAAEEVWT